MAISDVTVTGGAGTVDDLSFFGEGTAAGGIGCLGFGMSGAPTSLDTNLALENVLISGNTAAVVGGLMSVGCNLSVANSELSGNSADTGGAIITFDGDHVFTDVMVMDNSALTYAAGGFATFATMASKVSLVDTVVTNNENTDTEDAEGLLAIVGGADVTWTGTAGSGGSGLWGNTAPGTSALVFFDGGSLTADTLDFGVEADGTGNTDIDIAVDAGPQYWVGYDDASFTCADGECGTAVETDIMADPTSALIAEEFDVGFGAPFTVDSLGTLNAVEFYTGGSRNGCSMSFSLLSQSSTSTVWDVVWNETTVMSRIPGWVSAGEYGLPLDPNLIYAWHWNSPDCDYMLYVDIDMNAYQGYGSPTPIPVTGLGEYTMDRFLVDCSEGEVGESISCLEGPAGVSFGLRFSVTEL